MDILASDAERDATVDRLREAAAEGRLTLEKSHHGAVSAHRLASGA